MRDLNRIIIHCAATPWDMDIGVEEIRKWHKAKGWRDCGYHYVIRLNGNIEVGRPLEQSGAHCKGHNKDSIGICLVGGKDGTAGYTDAQWRSLRVLVEGLKKAMFRERILTDLLVQGHNDYTNAKTCPNFSVGEWYAS